MEQFGFGDFVFRLPDCPKSGERPILNALETMLQEVPAESVAYHAQRNHFSHWLMARTEFALAQKLRPRKVSRLREHRSTLRRDLIAVDCRLPREQSEVLIGRFQSRRRLRRADASSCALAAARWAAKRAAWRSCGICCAGTVCSRLSGRSRERSARGCPGDGCFRPLPRRERSARLCADLQRTTRGD